MLISDWLTGVTATPDTSRYTGGGGTSTTPRIPLGELDSSQVSQRLFHQNSPVNQSHASMSQTSPGVSVCHISSSSVCSPNSLLNTQVPQSSLIRERRQQRQQRDTERQVWELKQQVQELGNMMGEKINLNLNQLNVFSLSFYLMHIQKNKE